MTALGVRDARWHSFFGVFAAATLLLLAAPAVGASSPPLRGSFTTVNEPEAGSAPGQGDILQGISENGTLVGIYEDSGNLDHGFTERSGRFLTINDPKADTGTITPPNTGQGTNAYSGNATTVVGDYVGSSGFFQGFIFKGGKFSTLDDPNAGSAPGQGTMPYYIDASGAIVGAGVGSGGVQHGFVYEDGTFSDFNDPNAGTASGEGTALTCLSPSGVLVGSYSDSGGVAQGFAYQAGRFIQFNDPNAASGQTFPICANNHGEFVGEYIDNSGLLHGFSFQAGIYRTIDDPNGTEGTAVAAVNDSGLMDGYYVDSQGDYHGFVFSP